MTSIINGSSPTVTFSDGTTQATAGLPLTGGTVTGNVTTSGLTIGTTALGAGNATRFKNRIINGDMRIDQRNAGASVTPSSSGAYLVDRWAFQFSQASKFTVQQNQGSVTLPSGFTNYLGFTVASTVSVGSSDYFNLYQRIEGLNVGDLGWGTSNAKTVTLSFQIYSSLTGTFSGALQNSAGNRSYPFTFSVSSANTWTTASVTIAGDTSGTWLTTNGVGIALFFNLGTGSTYLGTAGSWASAGYVGATGSTSVVGTSGATFYITGVQLEVGSSATGFEYVDYGTQLAMCQRYFQSLTGGSYAALATGASLQTNASGLYAAFPVTMRVAPAVTYSGTLAITDRTAYDLNITSISNYASGPTSTYIVATHASSATQFRVAFLVVANGQTGALLLSSEL